MRKNLHGYSSNVAVAIVIGNGVLEGHGAGDPRQGVKTHGLAVADDLGMAGRLGRLGADGADRELRAVRMFVVVQDIQDSRRTIGGGELVVARDRPIVDRVHGDCNGRNIRHVQSVGGDVGEGVLAVEVGVGRIGEGTVGLQVQGAAGRPRLQQGRQGVAVGVGVLAGAADGTIEDVADAVGDGERDILVDGVAVVGRHRCLADVDDDDSHRGSDAGAGHLAIDNIIGKRDVTGCCCCRCKDQGAAGYGDGAVARNRRLRDAGDRQGVVFRIRIVVEHADRDSIALQRYSQVIDGGGQVVDRRDIDGDGSGVGDVEAVGHGVGEGVGAVEVEGRRVGDGAVSFDNDGAVGRLRHDCRRENIPVFVGIVGGDGNIQCDILVGVVAVIGCDGGVGDADNEHGDSGAVAAASAIDDGVGERVLADRGGGRREADGVVTEQLDNTFGVCRVAGHGDAQRVVVDIFVIGQHVDGDHLALGRRHGVVDGVGCIVHRRHLNGDGG